MTLSIQRRLALTYGTALACMARSAFAQAAGGFPSRSIRLIVPSPPAGGTDGFARLLADGLRKFAKWELSIENLPGGSGTTGAEAAARSSPDGYTVVMGESANLTINQFLVPTPRFDPASGLAPVALVARVPLAFVVDSARGIHSYADLIKEGRSRILKLASGGIGTVGHLVAEHWRRAANVPIDLVVYKGGSEAIAEVASGRADLHVASVPAAAELIRAGTIRGVAVTSFSRSGLLPDVPSLTELGLAGLEAYVIYGVMAPAGVPHSIIDQINKEINRVLIQPDIRHELSRKGADKVIFGGTPAQLGDFLWYDRRRWARVLSDSGFSVK